MQFSSDVIKKFQPLADKIRATLLYKEGSIQEEVRGKAFNDNLPKKYTPEDVVELEDYKGHFVTASHVAVGDMGADIFIKDPSITTIEAEVGFNGPKDAISISMERSHVFQNPMAKSEEDKHVTKHLSMTTSVDMKGPRGISLKRVKDAMGAEFAGTFKT